MRRLQVRIRILAQRLKEKLKKYGFVRIAGNYFKQIGKGYKVYRSLVEKYGDKVHIYIEHYPGTGDIYISCALLEKLHNSRQMNGDYVVTVVGKGAAQVAKQLNIKNIEILSQEESNFMILFIQFMSGYIQNSTILHYSPAVMHTSILDMLAGYNELDFMTMYLSVIFPGLTWQEAGNFLPVEDESPVDEYFAARGLEQGKTVVLFPFANTIENLPWQLWEELARHLREHGFSVCTNIERGRMPIPGTCDVFVPYKYLKRFVEKAGIVVGIRNGIFDIIADTQCHKFLLYPTPNFFKFGVGTILDYFSLQKMGICSEVYEYGFERIYEQEAFKLLYTDILNLCQGGQERKRLPYRRKYRHICRLEPNCRFLTLH